MKPRAICLTSWQRLSADTRGQCKSTAWMKNDDLERISLQAKTVDGKTFRRENILKAMGVKNGASSSKIEGRRALYTTSLSKGKCFGTKTVQYDDYPNAEKFLYSFFKAALF